ncbi:hypothetical protein E4U42_008000 [Claviceps africana]|uniref:Uncharacterized protein n=1 Tax=Claviceps africana TaxID=83212 RepID=A0A8K0JD91_9HYPO|nr:hypothetical protein E4U42_008000 [Claviceps africana]
MSDRLCTARKKTPSKKKAVPFQDGQDEDDDDDDKNSAKKAMGLKRRAVSPAEGKGKKLKCATKNELEEEDEKVDLLQPFYDDI